VLFRKRKTHCCDRLKYAEITAEEALLKAKIIAQSEETYTQAEAYLEEANKWYILSKDRKARNKISYILQKAKKKSGRSIFSKK